MAAQRPRSSPKTMPEKAKMQVSKEPSQRPPRYAILVMGLVKISWKVSRWKSRNMDGPKTPAMTMTPKRQKRV